MWSFVKAGQLERMFDMYTYSAGSLDVELVGATTDDLAPDVDLIGVSDPAGSLKSIQKKDKEKEKEKKSRRDEEKKGNEMEYN